jgi:diguanylate cyclase (GGDEF)-like protein/PAS domain S-box-containing protein
VTASSTLVAPPLPALLPAPLGLPSTGIALALAAALCAALAAAAAWWAARRRARTAERRLREAESRHRALVERNGVGIWQVTPTGRTIYLNPAMCELLEIDSAFEVVGESYQPFFTPESLATIQGERPLRERGGISSYEVELLGRRGSRRHLMMSGAPVLDDDGRLHSMIGTCLDITARRRAEDALRDSESRLSYLADHDALTDLLNRRRFERELRLALTPGAPAAPGAATVTAAAATVTAAATAAAAAAAERPTGALLWVDVDHFKHVNDSLGHRTGDDLLVKVAASLRHHVRPGDILARLAGDEFAALLPGADAAEASRVARCLVEAVRSITVKVDGKPVRTTISIGIALFPEHGVGSEELLLRADLATYEAKRGGRNRYKISGGSAEWQAGLASDMQKAERIREALEGTGFELFLQPVIDLRPAAGERSPRRFEALLRLRGPAGEVLLPEEFLGTAARFGMMRDIDRWVVATAIRLIADEAARGSEIHLDVNLSGDSFADRELLPWIESEIQRAALAPRCLALEITETAAVTDLAQARGFIEALRRLGCQLAIDDFGVGFSSLYYLKHLPVDLLKIDGSFIHDLPRNTASQHMVRAITSMARGLGILSVAEYVEDEETLAWARLHGVDFAQGFHVGRPRPAREVLGGTAEPATRGAAPDPQTPVPLAVDG